MGERKKHTALEGLSERERKVLEEIIHHYILTATPVGSRFLEKRAELGLSSASIRNVMSDLEFMGLIGQPHTSAGRVPTDRGYRFYVDLLMRSEKLSGAEGRAIREQLVGPDHDDLLREAARLAGSISHQLGIVAAPRLSSGRVSVIELVILSTTRLLVVIGIEGGLARTITFEVATELPRIHVDALGRLLNERLAGLTLREVRSSFAVRMHDATDASGLVRIFIDNAEKLFDEGAGRVHLSGASAILTQPEFQDEATFENLQSIIELMENEEMVVHLVESHGARDGEVRIAIGEETRDTKLANYSLVTTQYHIGDTSGVVAIIGPKRMNYAKMVTVVQAIAGAISEK